MDPNNNSDEFVNNIEVVALSPSESELTNQTRDVIIEAPLTIDIKDVGAYTIMCTPSDKLALAVGFAFSEGLIKSIDQINLLMLCPDDPGVIRMQIAPTHDQATSPRNLLITSSCGLCGSENLQSVIASLPVVANTSSVTTEQLIALIDTLAQHQPLFKRTGGAHAAAIARPDGRIIAACEDLGRHNALDKAIGTALLNKTPITGTIAILSGRVSFEILAKAARAGCEIIAAVSAPSTLAIQTANHCNITLAGFVRPHQATIYTHPHRVKKQ